jgi:hypothetical protein
VDVFHNLSGTLKTPTNKLINQKQQTQKRLDLICCCATMSTLDDEDAIQGILTNVTEEKVKI